MTQKSEPKKTFEKIKKKKCTNGNCRKEFILTDTVTCPYCGKFYPRLMTEDKKRSRSICKNKYIINFIKNNKNLDKVNLIKMVKEKFKISLMEAKRCVDNYTTKGNK